MLLVAIIVLYGLLGVCTRSALSVLLRHSIGSCIQDATKWERSGQSVSLAA